jgi:hypothetical protein
MDYIYNSLFLLGFDNIKERINMNRKAIALYIKELRRKGNKKVLYTIIKNLKIIRSAGAYFIGIQYTENLRALYMFNEPLKDSTLAIYEENISSASVLNKILDFLKKCK